MNRLVECGTPACTNSYSEQASAPANASGSACKPAQFGVARCGGYVSEPRRSACSTPKSALTRSGGRVGADLVHPRSNRSYGNSDGSPHVSLAVVRR